MATIVNLAEAIKNGLNDMAFSWSCVAERGYRPREDLKDMDEVMVAVIPASQAPDEAKSTRGGTGYEYRVDVGVQYHYPDDEPEDLDPLMDLVEEIMDHLRGLDVSHVAGAKILGLRNDPVYVPEHMRQRVFTSVINVRYAAWR